MVPINLKWKSCIEKHFFFKEYSPLLVRDSLFWLVGLDSYSRESFDDRSTGKWSALPGFLGRFAPRSRISA